MALDQYGEGTDIYCTNPLFEVEVKHRREEISKKYLTLKTDVLFLAPFKTMELIFPVVDIKELTYLCRFPEDYSSAPASTPYRIRRRKKLFVTTGWLPSSTMKL